MLNGGELRCEELPVGVATPSTVEIIGLYRCLHTSFLFELLSENKEKQQQQQFKKPIAITQNEAKKQLGLGAWLSRGTFT